MILYICLFLFVLGVVGNFVFNGIYYSYDIKDKLQSISIFFMLFFGLASIVLAVLCLVANINQEGSKAAKLQEYEFLQYEIDNEMYYNDNDYGLKELYDDVIDFNSTVVDGRIANKNIWISNLIEDYWEDIPLVEYNKNE